MIEPHSAQLGASSWILNATFVLPSDRVTVPEPLPLEPAFAGAAWPLVATTASSSRAGEEAPLETELAAAVGVFPPFVDCSAGDSVVVAVSTATDALGTSLAGSGGVDPPVSAGGSTIGAA